jgi:hypothetical protein
MNAASVANTQPELKQLSGNGSAQEERRRGCAPPAASASDALLRHGGSGGGGAPAGWKDASSSHPSLSHNRPRAADPPLSLAPSGDGAPAGRPQRSCSPPAAAEEPQRTCSPPAAAEPSSDLVLDSGGRGAQSYSLALRAPRRGRVAGPACLLAPSVPIEQPRENVLYLMNNSIYAAKLLM